MGTGIWPSQRNCFGTILVLCLAKKFSNSITKSADIYSNADLPIKTLPFAKFKELRFFNGFRVHFIYIVKTVYALHARGQRDR